MTDDKCMNGFDQYCIKRTLVLHSYVTEYKQKVNILHVLDLYCISLCSGLPPPGGVQPDAVRCNLMTYKGQKMSK